jgi:carbonic anhydrase
MKNKLFIVCPFSQMELFLQKKYGNEIYFITALASIMQWNQKEDMDAIRDFIIRESVQEIYLVHDTGCRFINNIITKHKLYGLLSEEIIQNIYVEHYLSDFENKELSVQQFKLAELSIKYQAEEITKSDVLGIQIIEDAILLKGLITSKKKNLFKEINIKQLKNI